MSHLNSACYYALFCVVTFLFFHQQQVTHFFESKLKFQVFPQVYQVNMSFSPSSAASAASDPASLPSLVEDRRSLVFGGSGGDEEVVSASRTITRNVGEVPSSASSSIASLLRPVIPFTPAPAAADADLSAIGRVAMVAESVAEVLDQVVSTVNGDALGTDAPPGTVTFEEFASVPLALDGTAPEPVSVSSTVLAPSLGGNTLQEHNNAASGVEFLENAGSVVPPTAAVASGGSSFGVPQVSSSAVGSSGLADRRGGSHGVHTATAVPSNVVNTAATGPTLNPTASGTQPTVGDTVHTVPRVSFQVLSQGGAPGNSFRENIAPTQDPANFGNFGGVPANLSNFGGAPGNFATASNFGGVPGNFTTLVTNNLTSLSSPYLPGQAPMSNVLGSTPMSRAQPSMSHGFPSSGGVPSSQVMPSIPGVQPPTSASPFVQPPSAASYHVQPTSAGNIQVNSSVPSPVPPAFLPGGVTTFPGGGSGVHGSTVSAVPGASGGAAAPHPTASPGAYQHSIASSGVAPSGLPTASSGYNNNNSTISAVPGAFGGAAVPHSTASHGATTVPSGVPCGLPSAPSGVTTVPSGVPSGLPTASHGVTTAPINGGITGGATGGVSVGASAPTFSIGGVLMSFGVNNNNRRDASHVKRYNIFNRPSVGSTEEIGFRKSLLDSVRAPAKIKRPDSGSWCDLKALVLLASNYMVLSRIIDTIKQYDLQHSFLVLTTLPTDQQPAPPFIDLLSQNFIPSSLTAIQVAHSSKWYQEEGNVVDPNDSSKIVYPFYDSLELSMDVFRANIDTALLSSIQASMASFDRECHGGPLCLFYLLRELFPQVEFAVDQIIVMVLKVNISSQFQDDVPKCVEVIRAALDFVCNVRHSHGQSPLPANYVSKVVPVFKTTSNDEFNNQFLHFASTIRLQSLHTYQQAHALVSDSDNLLFLL